MDDSSHEISNNFNKKKDFDNYNYDINSSFETIEKNKYYDKYGEITNVDFKDELLMNLIKNNIAQNKNIDLFFKALSLCHSVIAFNNPANGKLDYFASSLDEKAIVNGCRYLNYIYMNKDSQNKITLKINEKDHMCELLCTLDFDSERKRMSVIVKDESDRIYLFMKGADDVVRPLCKRNPDYIPKNKNQNYYFSTKGLRTLNVAYKEIENEEFRRWESQYKVNILFSAIRQPKN